MTGLRLETPDGESVFLKVDGRLAVNPERACVENELCPDIPADIFRTGPPVRGEAASYDPELAFGIRIRVNLAIPAVWPM